MDIWKTLKPWGGISLEEYMEMILFNGKLLKEIMNGDFIVDENDCQK